MYKIYADGAVVYDPMLATESYSVTSPKLSMSLNKAGSLSFLMPPTHPLYSSIQKLKTVLTVYDGDEEIWSGRAIDDTTNFYNTKDVYAEGRLSFLLDSIRRPYTFTGSVRDYVELLVSNHNSQVDAFKRFTVGNVTVEDPNDYIVRENESYEQTFTEIENKLLKRLGGYLNIRKDGDNYYLDYLAESGSLNPQTIEFGKNILDLSKYITAEDVFTVLIPLGADDDENGRLTIASVNDGRDYIVDQTAAAIFGLIWRTEEWDDVTIAENLLSKGRAFLSANVEMAVTLKLKAVDLAMLDVDVSALRLGQKNRVISLPHNLDALFTLSQVDLDLAEPENSDYTFGVTYTTITDRQAEISKSVTTVNSAAASAQASASAAATAAEEVAQVVAELPQGYVSTATFTAYRNSVDGKLAVALCWRGTVSSVSALPLIGNSIGDVYNVADTGANYVFTSGGWDKLSENVDLSDLVTSADFSALEARVAALENGGE